MTRWHALAAAALVGLGGCAASPSGPDPGVAHALTAAVDASLPYDFVVRADIVAEESGQIRCASRVLGTDPASAGRLGDVRRAYLVAVCVGRTPQAVAKGLPPVCLVVPVVAAVGGRTHLPLGAFTVLDSARPQLDTEVRDHFPARLRRDALRAGALAGPLWARLGQDPAGCGQ